MITTVLFQPELPNRDVEASVERLRSSFTVTEYSTLWNLVRSGWKVESGNCSFDVLVYDAVQEYGITHAVHVDASEIDLLGTSPYELTRYAADYYNIVHTLMAGIGTVFGLGDFDERFEPRYLPSRWQYRDGVFEEPFWLTVFGSGYTDRYGTETLLNAPLWHATEIGDCVLTLLSPSPAKAPEGKDSLREAGREFTAYLEQHTDKDAL